MAVNPMSINYPRIEQTNLSGHEKEDDSDQKRRNDAIDAALIHGNGNAPLMCANMDAIAIPNHNVLWNGLFDSITDEAIQVLSDDDDALQNVAQV